MNILITGAWRCGEEQKAAVRALGHQIIKMPDERGELPCAYSAIDAVICNGLFLYHPIEKFTALRYIQLTSAGLDRVPVEYIQSHGIALFNARDVYSIPMAEFAVSGKTVCVLGCGSVGRHCAGLFRAFGCTVIGVARNPREDGCFDRICPMSYLEEALAQADVTILALPLTDETRHLMDSRRLSWLKQGSILVNLARGGLVDTQALMAALETRLGGAVLDVFEEEPLSGSSPLWDMDNVILTPHNSFVGDGNEARLFRVIIENLENWK